MPKRHRTRKQPLLFPWCHTSCGCGARIAVAWQDGWSWIPDAGDPGTAHPDVEPCAHCHCLMLRPGSLTIVERPGPRRFVPETTDLMRRRN